MYGPPRHCCVHQMYKCAWISARYDRYVLPAICMAQTVPQVVPCLRSCTWHMCTDCPTRPASSFITQTFPPRPCPPRQLLTPLKQDEALCHGPRIPSSTCTRRAWRLSISKTYSMASVNQPDLHDQTPLFGCLTYSMVSRCLRTRADSSAIGNSSRHPSKRMMTGQGMTDHTHRMR